MKSPHPDLIGRGLAMDGGDAIAEDLLQLIFINKFKWRRVMLTVNY